MAPAARYESEDVDVSPLGRPLKFEFSGKTAPNRFLKAAMTERISSWVGSAGRSHRLVQRLTRIRTRKTSKREASRLRISSTFTDDGEKARLELF